MRLIVSSLLVGAALALGCSARHIGADREFDQTTHDERRKIEAFKNTPEYPRALAAVVTFTAADYGRVLWCECVYYEPETHYGVRSPEAFVFRVFVPNDGTFIEKIPEMTTLVGWLPDTKEVHGYYQDIFPHPWDSNTCDSSGLLSETAKARLMKREAERSTLLE